MTRPELGKTVRLLILAAVALTVCGCHIPNRVYRAGVPVVTVPPPPQLPMKPGSAWPPHPEAKCDQYHLRDAPCLAFIEFDDFGEVWEKSAYGRPAQLNSILSLIEEAKRQDPIGRPLILTFVHGWKHNASAGNKSGDDDSNIIGVESVLNDLYSDPQLNPDPNRKHVILGIYVAWRGGLISPYWPVAQQFTYWNREATAMRVGNTSMTDALIEISDQTYKNASKCTPDQETTRETTRSEQLSLLSRSPSPPRTADWTNGRKCTPVLLFVGHSFGALALERALSQATVTRLEREYNEKGGTQLNGQSVAIDQPLADLVIYVNSAAAATESKQLMDYLASSHFTYQPAPAMDQPLFLSVTSEADLATGMLLKVGHALPLLGYKLNGSMRAKPSTPPPSRGSTSDYARACFDPANPATSMRRFDLSQTDYFMSTTAHNPGLWSHELTSPATSVVPSADPQCMLSPAGPAFASCRIAQQTFSITPVEGRCNGTPYWAIQIKKEIVPDHGTIFTRRFIEFLKPFIQNAVQTAPVLSEQRELPSVETP